MTDVTLGTAVGGSEEQQVERSLRADARRNVQKVLDAAEALFASEGLAVPIDTIAARAGVGVGTVYRHFPTKEVLFRAVVASHLEKLVAKAQELADSLQPMEALFTFMREVVKSAAKKRDLHDQMARAGLCEIDVEADIKARLTQAFATLLARAQAAGEVRPDVTGEDVTGLLMGACLVGGGASEPSPAMLRVVFDGLRV